MDQSGVIIYDRGGPYKVFNTRKEDEMERGPDQAETKDLPPSTKLGKPTKNPQRS